MKNFSFSMFNNKTELIKKRRNNIVAIEKMRVQFFQCFFLWYKTTKNIRETGIFRFLALFLKI